MIWLIVQFVCLAAIIVVAGIYLTRFASQIADLTGLGHSLAGLLLLALATSLPELAVNIRAAMIPAIDLAVGSTLGSSLFNLMILAVLDLGRRSTRGRMLSPVAAAHTLSATASLVLTSIAGLFLALDVEAAVFGIGLGSWGILAAYLLFLRLIFFDQQFAALRDEGRTDGGHAAVSPGLRLAPAVRGYFVATVVVFAAATALVPAADKLADESGLGRTFVGTSMVALASSLPEIVTTFAAVRLGSIALAVGNIFGSNAFNMVMLLPVDVLYRGSALHAAEDTHIVTAFCVVIVTSVAMAGMLYRPTKKYWILDPDAAGVLLLIVSALGLIYYLGLT